MTIYGLRGSEENWGIPVAQVVGTPEENWGIPVAQVVGTVARRPTSCFFVGGTGLKAKICRHFQFLKRVYSERRRAVRRSKRSWMEGCHRKMGHRKMVELPEVSSGSK